MKKCTSLQDVSVVFEIMKKATEMFAIFTPLLLISIAAIAESSPLMAASDGVFRAPPLTDCGRYGIMRSYGSDCWKQCSDYDIKTIIDECTNIVVTARCQCDPGFIIDDLIGGTCVLPQDCKRHSRSKKIIRKHQKNHDLRERNKHETIMMDRNSP